MKVLYCDTDLVRRHLAEAMVIAGLPKRVDLKTLGDDITAVYQRLQFAPGSTAQDDVTAHLDRAQKLGVVKPSTGHDSFLKGVVVTAVVSAPAYQWPQIQRYHFLDIISSQSKMHKITDMDLAAQCNGLVDDSVIDLVNNLIDEYNEKQDYLTVLKSEGASPAVIAAAEKWVRLLFRRILSNTPHGLTLAAGIVTNYLQLKTMKQQRKTHDLEEWADDFVSWVDSLPMFNELTGV